MFFSALETLDIEQIEEFAAYPYVDLDDEVLKLDRSIQKIEIKLKQLGRD